MPEDELHRPLRIGHQVFQSVAYLLDLVLAVAGSCDDEIGARRHYFCWLVLIRRLPSHLLHRSG
jgi:hypothetical protein